MNINDTSKDQVLDDLLANINKAQLFLTDNYYSLNENGMRDVKEKIRKLTLLYNQMIEKRVNRANSYMLRPLKVPGPQSEEEKRKLLELIDSV